MYLYFVAKPSPAAVLWNWPIIFWQGPIIAKDTINVKYVKSNGELKEKALTLPANTRISPTIIHGQQSNKV